MFLALLTAAIALSIFITLNQKGGEPQIQIIKGLTPLPLASHLEAPQTPVNHRKPPTILIILNNGTEDLTIENITIQGPNTKEFGLEFSNTPQNIPPGEYETLSLYFFPKTPGHKWIIMEVESNDPYKPIYNLNVTAMATAAPPPKDVHALAENGRVTLNWSGVENATSYNIYFSTTPLVSKGHGNAIKNTTSPYIHQGLTNGVTYFYVITAQTPYGEGEESTPVSATPGKTYYVDNENGDDNNDGLTAESAWKTLEKVNSMRFQPGENILFKKGGFWRGVLEIHSSGVEGRPITFGAYGEGDKPIITGRGSIPGWYNQSNWMRHQQNIWSIYYGPYKIASRVWLSGVEYVKAQVLSDVNKTYPWYYDLENSRLYLYAEKNPAEYYSSVEESMAIEGTALRIEGRDHITIRDLDIRGGRTAIEIIGSSHINVEDCQVGLYTGHIGIWISGDNWSQERKPSEHGIIRGCIIDSGYHLSYYYEKAQTEDGIHMRDNVSHWEVYGNEFWDWGHNAISLGQFEEGATVSHNRFHSNLMTAPHISYGRGVGVVGREGGAQFNEFFNNLIVNTTVPNQIGGDHNSFYYNIIHTVKNTRVYPENVSPGIVLTPAMICCPGYVSNYNKIYNNVVYGTDGAGIVVEGWPNGFSIKHNEVVNNIILECGGNAVYWDQRNIGLYIYPRGWGESPTETATHNTYMNNIIYKEGATKVVSYNGTAMTVAEFNELNGAFNDTIGANLQVDPLLVDAKNLQLYPRYLSPAIDAGISLCLKNDFQGTQVPQGKKPDIGALEYH